MRFGVSTQNMLGVGVEAVVEVEYQLLAAVQPELHCTVVSRKFPVRIASIWVIRSPAIKELRFSVEQCSVKLVCLKPHVNVEVPIHLEVENLDIVGFPVEPCPMS